MCIVKRVKKASFALDSFKFFSLLIEESQFCHCICNFKLIHFSVLAIQFSVLSLFLYILQNSTAFAGISFEQELL